jgi:hypothetical protein
VEGVPIRAKNFAVYVNRYRVTPHRWSGNRIPVMEGTPYGIMHGEIVILPASQASTENMGIEIKVKGVTVRRELFNIASWGKAATRIRGEIHADFLLLTSDRSGFMEDTPEFEAFLKGSQKIIAGVEKVYKQLYKRESRKKEAHILNIARLITQEISLMKDSANPRDAFNRQSKLLRDAFKDVDDYSRASKSLGMPSPGCVRPEINFKQANPNSFSAICLAYVNFSFRNGAGAVFASMSLAIASKA